MTKFEKYMLIIFVVSCITENTKITKFGICPVESSSQSRVTHFNLPKSKSPLIPMLRNSQRVGRW